MKEGNIEQRRLFRRDGKFPNEVKPDDLVDRTKEEIEKLYKTDPEKSIDLEIKRRETLKYDGESELRGRQISKETEEERNAAGPIGPDMSDKNGVQYENFGIFDKENLPKGLTERSVNPKFTERVARNAYVVSLWELRGSSIDLAELAIELTKKVENSMPGLALEQTDLDQINDLLEQMDRQKMELVIKEVSTSTDARRINLDKADLVIESKYMKQFAEIIADRARQQIADNKERLDARTRKVK